MKRMLYFFAVIVLVITLAHIKKTNAYIKENVKYTIDVQEVKITSLNERETPYDNLFVIYGHEKKYGWTEQLRQEVKGRENEYLLVTLKYVLQNESKDIFLEQIEFHPQFGTELMSNVKACNYGHDNQLLFAYPKSKVAMTQNILIKAEELSRESLYEKILNEEVSFQCRASILKSSFETQGGVVQKNRIKLGKEG